MTRLDRESAENALQNVERLAVDMAALANRQNAIVNLAWAGWMGVLLALLFSPQGQFLNAHVLGFALSIGLLVFGMLIAVWSSRVFRPFFMAMDRRQVRVILASGVVGFGLSWMLGFGHGLTMPVYSALLGFTISLGFAVTHLVWRGGLDALAGLAIVFVIQAIAAYGGSRPEQLGWLGLFGILLLAVCGWLTYRERRP